MFAGRQHPSLDRAAEHSPEIVMMLMMVVIMCNCCRRLAWDCDDKDADADDGEYVQLHILIVG